MKESTDGLGTRLCVLRHGDAGAHVALPARDRLRPLTPKGRRQSKRAERWWGAAPIPARQPSPA